jgi:hypothetical protein
MKTAQVIVRIILSFFSSQLSLVLRFGSYEEAGRLPRKTRKLNAYREVEVQFPSLTLAIGGGERSMQRPDRFNPGERPGTH